MQQAYGSMGMAGMVLLWLAGLALAGDPGELFPNVPFETESASDGTSAKDMLPPPPPKVEIMVPMGKDSALATTEPAVIATPVSAQPGIGSTPAASDSPAQKLPWFLSTAKGKEVLDKMIADPKEGLKSAKELGAGKTGPDAEEAELLTAIAEYVSGQGVSAHKRFDRLVQSTDKRRVRAAVIYLEVMTAYTGGRLKNASLADPNVLGEAIGMCVKTLVQKAQDLTKKASRTQVANLDSYNKGVDLFVQAKAALSLADYFQPEADHTKMAADILREEISLRRKGIELILARADKRKERIDQIAGSMKFNKEYQGATNVWSPKASAQEVNAFVEAMLRDKKRVEELMGQIKELLKKSDLQTDLGDLDQRIANADKVKVEFPSDWGRDFGHRGGWTAFKRFGNLYRMFQDDPSEQDPGRGFRRFFENSGWITVKPIAVCP